jgi:hypothetical protein
MSPASYLSTPVTQITATAVEVSTCVSFGKFRVRTSAWYLLSFRRFFVVFLWPHPPAPTPHENAVI